MRLPIRALPPFLPTMVPTSGAENVKMLKEVEKETFNASLPPFLPTLLPTEGAENLDIPIHVQNAEFRFEPFLLSFQKVV